MKKTGEGRLIFSDLPEIPGRKFEPFVEGTAEGIRIGKTGKTADLLYGKIRRTQFFRCIIQTQILHQVSRCLPQPVKEHFTQVAFRAAQCKSDLFYREAFTEMGVDIVNRLLKRMQKSCPRCIFVRRFLQQRYQKGTQCKHRFPVIIRMITGGMLKHPENQL